MRKIWFTADLHLGHSQIIQYCNRPFANVDEMDEELIDRWNEVVGEKDDIYILGDVAISRPAMVIPLVKRLRGRKHLIIGNHDRKNLDHREFRDLFVARDDIHTVKVQDPSLETNVQRIVLCHYALRSWNHSHRGAWSLFGHSHGNLPDDPNLMSLDVGVDCWDYRPIDYEKIKEAMSKKMIDKLLVVNDAPAKRDVIKIDLGSINPAEIATFVDRLHSPTSVIEKDDDVTKNVAQNRPDDL